MQVQREMPSGAVHPVAGCIVTCCQFHDLALNNTATRDSCTINSRTQSST